MARAKKELKAAPPLSRQAQLLQRLRASGVSIESAASAMQKWRYIDFVNPLQELPCITLEWLVGARGFLAGRILQLRAQFSKGKSSYMYLQYAMGQLLSRAFCQHYETEGAQAPADYIASFGCNPTDLLISEVQALEACLEQIDQTICEIRGGFGGTVSEASGRMVKTKYTDPLDPTCESPIIIGIDSLSSLGKDDDVNVDVCDAGGTPQLSYHTRKLRDYFRNRVGRFRDTQTFLMLTSHETANIKVGKGPAKGGDKSALAQAAIGIHATYGIDVDSTPYRDKERGLQLGDIVKMRTFKNKLSPRYREVELYLVWNHGFDLIKTDWEFLSKHPASPFAVTVGQKPLLYKHSNGITCKPLSDKSFASEEDFLRAFYNNNDMLMEMREKMRIRGCGFAFESQFMKNNPTGELPEEPGGTEGYEDGEAAKLSPGDGGALSGGGDGCGGVFS